MDARITAAARALSRGDPLTALNGVSLRNDPPALALRGVALAQLGDLLRGRELLKQAARAFGPREALARARCHLAEAEIDLAVRDLSAARRALAPALRILESHGDQANAGLARLIDVRCLLLMGRVAEASAALDAQRSLHPAHEAVAQLAAAEIALRRLDVPAARLALAAAEKAATQAGVPALAAEVEAAREATDRVAARSIRSGVGKPLRLEEVAAVLGSKDLVVDACRRAIGSGRLRVTLARKPVLLALARALAEAWPGDVDRDELAARIFEARKPNASHRARLRVEAGRLRRSLAAMAAVEATPRGYKLAAKEGRSVVVLAPPMDGDHGAVLALLADGEGWSTSALAMALGASQRTVQRALAALDGSGAVRSIGQGRARRWLAAPLAPFATALLLPSPASNG